MAAGVALIATTSTAALAFTGQPGSNAAPVTGFPDLTSVTLDASNAYGDRQAATFCFDETLTTTYTPANFFVKTYDANRFLQGQTAAVDPSSTANGKCVIVTFNPNIDLNSQGSLGEVDGGAVTDTGGQPNYYSSAPLIGSTLKQTPGQTTGPDLLSAVGRQSDHTVEYTFDQQVDPASLSFADFGITSSAGADTAGVNTTPPKVDTATSKKVRVTFPDAAQVESATRYFVNRGAVRTLAYDGLSGGAPTNPYAPTTDYTLGPPGAVGTGTSTRPVLKTATQQLNGSSQFVLEYSTDLGTFDEGGIIAVRDNGQVEKASSSTPVSGSTTKRLVSFPNDGAVDREPSGVVSIVSQTGAATTQAGNAPAPISAVNVGPGAPSTPGLTNGPDLLNTALDTTTSQASFIYDEPVDKTAVAAPMNFQLLVDNGAPIGGIAQGGVSSDGKTVLIGYPGSIEAGVGVSTALDATEDRVGNKQQYTSVSSKVVTLPPEGTASPTPAPSTTPTAVTVQTKVSIKHKRGSKKFTGKITTKTPCKKRVVRIYKGSKQIKSKKDKGKFTIRFKKRPKGKVRIRITAKTISKDGVTYTCTAAKSKKVKA